MKKTLAIIGVGVIVVCLMACMPEQHLLWGIPYEIQDKEFIKRVQDEKGIVFSAPYDYFSGCYVSEEVKDVDYLGMRVKEVTLYVDATYRYIESSIDFGDVHLPHNESEDQLQEFIDKLNILYQEMKECYGRPTKMYYMLFNYNNDRPRETVDIEDYYSDVTPERCIRLMRQSEPVGIKIEFGNVLLNGIIEGDGANPKASCSVLFKRWR